MHSKGGTASYFQIQQFSLVGGIFHSWGGMVPLEDLKVPRRGGTTPSKGGNIISEGGNIPMEGDRMIP